MGTATNSLIAAGTVAVGGLMVGLILAAEQQWVILTVLAAAVAMAVAAERTALPDLLSGALEASARTLTILLMGAGLVVASVLHEEHFALLMLATVFVYGLACLGLTIQFGFAGVLNFAGAAFFGIGGYTAAILGNGSAIPAAAVVLIAGLVAVAIGSILIAPVLRTKGHYAALITIAFGLLFRTFLEVSETLGGPQGLKVQAMRLLGFDLSEGIAVGDLEASFYFNYVVLSLALFALGLVLVRRIERSWIGLNLDVVRTDETAAAVFGIHVARWRITAFLLGNFIIGIAGACYAMMIGFVAPNNFTFSDSLLMLSIIIVGGIGNPWGVLPAAILVLVVPEKLQILGEYRFLVFAALVVLVLRFRPMGLFPRGLRRFQEDRGR